ncbi:MAG: type VI secretion system Vgr family protein [Pseudomonadota bacterium]
MARDSDFLTYMLGVKELSSARRPLRLKLAFPQGASDDTVLPQRVTGSEAVCGGFEYRVFCLATDCRLALKEFIAVPAEIQIVTDRGELRSICGIITDAVAGSSDGGMASYLLTIRDALSILDKRVNTRIFRKANELDIIDKILTEWRNSNYIFAGAFRFEFQCLNEDKYPRREFTMQHNESDAAFMRRLLKRRGISWTFRPEPDSAVPAHKLVMFDHVNFLPESSAGSVRFHRDNATEERDTITAWNAARSLQAGIVSRHSWDYMTARAPGLMTMGAHSLRNQGINGNELAAHLDDYLVEMPHVGQDNTDFDQLGYLRMDRHDYETKCFHGEGSVRDLCAGEYFSLDGHPEIDTHTAQEREFVVTAVQLDVLNNLPNNLHEQAERLFAHNRWDGDLLGANPDTRSRIRFTAVRRGIPIVPAYDPRVDLPVVHMQSAIVAGPVGEEVYCDRLGRVKIRFPATRVEDHEVEGATGFENDSAWVRVASAWAGDGMGAGHQCGVVTLPRLGSEVLVAFLGGDPDKPVIVGQMYHDDAPPPALSSAGDLPGNRYLSGMRSREVSGEQGNQLRFDDTKGQISAQLASDYGQSSLNLGALYTPRANGEATQRGEGAELRSDNAVAIRGATGVLISAQGSDAESPQLERKDFVTLAECLQDLATQLSKLAVTHAKAAEDGPELKQLVEKLKKLQEGGKANGDPVVAIEGPAGVIVASHESLSLGAKVNADVVAGASVHVSAGEGASVRAENGISLFANNVGIKAVAASGKVALEAQSDELEILAKKVLQIISATDWIELKARHGVRIYGGGSQLELSADGIKGYSAAQFQMYAAKHVFQPKQSKQAQFPDEIPHHEICVPCLLKAANERAALARAS